MRALLCSLVCLLAAPAFGAEVSCHTRPAKNAQVYRDQAYGDVAAIHGKKPAKHDFSGMILAEHLMQFLGSELDLESGHLRFKFDEATHTAHYDYERLTYSHDDGDRIGKAIDDSPSMATMMEHYKTGRATKSDLDRLVAEAKALPEKLGIQKTVVKKSGDIDGTLYFSDDAQDQIKMNELYGPKASEKYRVIGQTNDGSLKIGVDNRASSFDSQPMSCEGAEDL